MTMGSEFAYSQAPEAPAPAPRPRPVKSTGQEKAEELGGNWLPPDSQYPYWHDAKGLNMDAVYAEHIGKAGFDFGEEMRRRSQDDPFMEHVNTEAIDADRGRTAESYAQQQQAYGMMRAQAEGQGPSVAAQQQQQGLDDATRGMMAARGAPMLPQGMGQGQAAVNQAAQNRQQEIQQAQAGQMGAADQMRGQSLQDRQQALQNSYQASQLNQSQLQQNMQRELQMQQLGYGGYRNYANVVSAARDIKLGINSNRMAEEANMRAAVAGGIGSGAATMFTVGGKKDK